MADKKPYFENFHTAEGSSFTPYIDPTTPVEVYRNLNTGHWSVRQRQNGRMLVMLHTDYICLSDCQFVVQPSGRKRVLTEKRKHVHAFVKGFVCHPRETYQDRLPFEWDGVTYDPYKYDSFVFVDNATPVKRAKFVDLSFLAGSDCSVLAYLGV